MPFGEEQVMTTINRLSQISRASLHGALRLSVLSAVLLSAAAPALADACRPTLKVEQTAFTPMQKMQRTWTASVSADAAVCATTSGQFKLKIVRLKENGVDLAFDEGFTWRAGRSDVSLDVWADEAVASYEVGEIAPCPCRQSASR
jgi:hypothetical protein